MRHLVVVSSLLFALGAALGCGSDRAARAPAPVRGDGVEAPPEPDPDEPAPPSSPGGVGATCGTRGAAPCTGELFCLHPIEAQCGETDRPGTCQVRPEICTREYQPVCGCDGRSYGNECTAHAAGVAVRARGECPGGDDEGAEDEGEVGAACVRSGCGGELCVEPDADRQVSICVHRPEHACYDQATCARQADGSCGWTQTPTLRACLANPPR